MQGSGACWPGSQGLGAEITGTPPVMILLSSGLGNHAFAPQDDLQEVSR